MVTNTIKIDGRKIGDGHSPYIIAEMSANHNGEISNAYQIIDMAKECGADAVKLQTYRPGTITMNIRTPEFMIKGGNDTVIETTWNEADINIMGWIAPRSK